MKERDAIHQLQREEHRMLNSLSEVVETIDACATIVEQVADDHRELWAVIAALRSCEEYLDAQSESAS